MHACTHASCVHTHTYIPFPWPYFTFMLPFILIFLWILSLNRDLAFIPTSLSSCVQTIAWMIITSGLLFELIFFPWNIYFFVLHVFFSGTLPCSLPFTIFSIWFLFLGSACVNTLCCFCGICGPNLPNLPFQWRIGTCCSPRLDKTAVDTPAHAPLLSYGRISLSHSSSQTTSRAWACLKGLCWSWPTWLLGRTTYPPYLQKENSSQASHLRQ